MGPGKGCTMDMTQKNGVPAPKTPQARLLGFAKAEDGSILPFSMMVLFLMILIGGLAIDVMRHEEKRVAIQQTLDYSVLSAASLKQSLNPQTVVEDYFDKAGMAEYLTNVDVDSGLNYRTVNAEASADTQPFFMGMLGVDEFIANADSGAEERISNVEVSMVLDISGSMAGSRITNLRPAARDFIDTVLGNSEPGKATISIVPYSAQVNLGPQLMAQFNAPRIHDYTSCIELPDSVFNSIDLSRTQALLQNAHFDPFYDSNSVRTETNCSWYSGWATDAAAKTSNYVLPISSDAAVLKSKVNALKEGGNTSIDLGVKWGALLLSPNSRPITAGLIANGAVSPAHAARPLSFDPQETIKVLVVMTDGQNTTEYKLKPNFRNGASHIYASASGANPAAYFNRANTNNDYYILSTGQWAASAPAGSTVRTWQQVFHLWSVQRVAYNFYTRPMGTDFATQYYNMVELVNTTKNSRLQQVCTAAKEAGVVVYGIGFEAPENGRTQVRACASTDAQYFDASTTGSNSSQIRSVFQSIANQITMLRLTQ